MNGIYYTCPCCGYDKLELPPYKNGVTIPVDDNLKPPYRVHFGDGSYDVCSCCAFEYGLEDEPYGDIAGVSFKEYLAQWISDGCKWFYPHLKPVDWSLEEQLKKAGIKTPL